jgi:transcriptional regulator with XRE-family HTH domain
VAYVPTIKRRRLGSALRRLREQAGHSTESSAAALGWSQSKVSRIETATVAVSPADVRALLDLYDVQSEELTALVDLAMEDRPPSWWRQYSEVLPENFSGYLSLESEASRIFAYESEVVPGLLQTDDYARTVLAQHPLAVMPDEVERSTQLRRARQGRLHGDDPLHLDVVVSESALRRVVGGPAVMREQLSHLLEMAALPNVTLRILTFAAGAHPATNGSFRVLDFPDADDPRIVCLDTMVTTTYREGLREVGAFLLAHERLRGMALDPDRSGAFLRGLVKDGNQ